MKTWRKTLTSLIVWLPLYLVAGAGLLLASLSPFWDPASFAVPAFCGLYLWALVLLGLVLLVLGLVRRSKLTWIPFLCLLPVLVFAPRFARYDSRPARAGEEGLRVLTYNVFNFDPLRGAEARPLAESHRELARYCGAQHLDVLCFQEFAVQDTLALTQVFAAWPYHLYFFPRVYQGCCYGHVIFSKYPLSHGGHLLFEEGYKGCLWTRVHLDGERALTLFNVHLQSTNISLMDLGKNFYQKGKELPVEEGIKRAHLNLRAAFGNRSAQVRRICTTLEETPGPKLLCGDFNDTPLSFVYQRMKRAGMEDAFARAGHGLGGTYRFLYPLLRIDYLFHDASLEAGRQEVPHWPFSDHYPVITSLFINVLK